MWIFLKKFYRDMGEAKGQFISVLAVVIIGVMFYTALNSALEGLEGAGYRYFKEYRLADLWGTVYRAPEGVIKRIEEIPGVDMVNGRVQKDVRINMGRKEAMIRLISMPDRKRDIVNDIQLKSGSYFDTDAANQCIVSEDFFEANHLTFGQIIEPIINGDKVKLRIVGTAKSPEYTYEVRDVGQLIPDPESFGIVYVKKSYLQSALDYKGSVNDVSVLLEPDGDIKEVKKEMRRILNQYGLTGIVEKKDQISYSMFSTDVKALKSLSAVFPLLFFIASAVIIYITMTRMIENQRTQMGVLKALGYGNLDIMLHYQTYPLLVGMLGSILGVWIGVFFIGEGLLEIFNLLYDLPTGKTEPNAAIVLPAALLAMFFCIMAGYNACRRELYMVPALSMRPKAPAYGRRMFLEGFRHFWKRINFSWKIILRNIFRYKKRSAMASIGIIFSMVLLLVALGVKNSMDSLIVLQFSEIQKFHIKLTLIDMMDADELNYIRSIDHILSVEPVMETGMELTNGWRKKDIGIIALERGSELYGILDLEGKPLILPGEGLLLPEKTMRTMGLEPGDKAYLRSYYPGKNREKDKTEVVIRGAISQFIGQSTICSEEYMNYLLREGIVANAAYIRLEDRKYEQEVIEKLRDIVGISTIQSKSEVMINTQKMLKSMNSIIFFMVFGAGVLAFAVIYNITSINIFERRRELATLSVLGFKAGELKSIVFNENFFISILGAILGVLPGRIMNDLVIKTQTNDNMMMPAVLLPSSYIIAAMMIVVFTVIANMLLTRKILSINMVESLKSAE